MKNCLILVFSVLSFNASAQVSDVIVKGAVPNNYIVHTVQPKENWYSVGRLYNVNAKDLAKYNNLTVEKGLAIAQIIKAPINASNKMEPNVPLIAGEVAVPMYHIVEKSEGLYRIALNYGTTMQLIRDWNALTSDNLSTGTKLKVGFIKVKESESALAAAKVNEPIAAVPQPKETTPIKKTPPVVEETPPIIKEVAPKEEPIKKEPVKVEPIKKEPTTVQTNTNNSSSEGFFKNDYAKSKSSNKTMEGKAATFKTMAGWDDEKYYALIDGVPSGSIIKVTNKLNEKVVYVKVLGEMQELKQNHGLIIRISNATANALGASGETFEVNILY